ncbi:MAG TPA: hypothetical protein VNL91_03810 [Thermoanaerobaculia bacterium]|nr:hypothetical protein [Thermoanaerobaculia bacterium]
MASDNTEARRERVKELFGKSDRRIAAILIEEGYFGAYPKTKPAQIKLLDTARRTVCRDRAWWQERWSESTERKRTETPQEYIARLRTRIEDLEDIAENTLTKPTPRVQAFAEIRQLEQAIAKAQGIDEVAAPPDGGESDPPPFLGIVVGLGKLSPEAKKKVHEWSGGGSE